MHRITLSKIFLWFGDFFAFFSSFFISLMLLPFINDNQIAFPKEELDEYIFIHLVISLGCVCWFWVHLRHYTYRKPFWFELKEIFRTLVIFFVIELAIIAFSKLYVSRTLWMLTWFWALILVPIVRIFFKKLLLKLNLYQKDTVIIGSGQNAKDVYRALAGKSYLGFSLCYFVSSDIIPENGKNEIKVIDARNKDIISLQQLDTKAVQFILALDDEMILDSWLRYLALNKYRSVSVIPNIRGIPLYGTDMSFLFSHEILLLRVNNNLAKRSSRILKRIMDVLGSLGIIILLSPVLLYLYFSVKKDGGNAIYGHPRIGRNGKIFKCLKFRSMVVNSKEVLDELLRTDPEARAEWEKDFKLKNDPRITKIGAFIRKTSLDELPQFINVFKGDMSIIGPRPDAYTDSPTDIQRMRTKILPGITGLAQVNGRSNLDEKSRGDYDLEYIEKYSFIYDLKIFIKTILIVVLRKGTN